MNLATETNVCCQACLCSKLSFKVLNSFKTTTHMSYYADFSFLAYRRSVSYSVVEDYWNPHEVLRFVAKKLLSSFHEMLFKTMDLPPTLPLLQPQISKLRLQPLACSICDHRRIYSEIPVLY